MVMIVGHRGARNLWPENSLSGFRKLLGLNVDAVEFDVHETRDRQLVVIHDPTLQRTTEKAGAIRIFPRPKCSRARCARCRRQPTKANAFPASMPCCCCCARARWNCTSRSRPTRSANSIRERWAA